MASPSIVGAGFNYLANQTEARKKQESMAQYMNELRGYLAAEQEAADANAMVMQGFGKQARDATGRLIDASGAPSSIARSTARAQFDAGSSADVAPGGINGLGNAGVNQQRLGAVRYEPEVSGHRSYLGYGVGEGAAGTVAANARQSYGRDVGLTGSDARAYGYSSDFGAAKRKRDWTLREAQLKNSLTEGSNSANNMRLLGAAGGIGESAALGMIM